MLWVVGVMATVTACGAGARDSAPDGRGDSATVSAVAEEPATVASAPPRAPGGTVAAGGFGTAIGFRSPQRLDEHFAKHGVEFGAATRESYLRQAQSLRDAPAEGTILEVRRPDGVISRFDRRSGAFLAFDADGTIRTFFRPNDGESYFRRQARRRPNP